MVLKGLLDQKSDGKSWAQPNALVENQSICGHVLERLGTLMRWSSNERAAAAHQTPGATMRTATQPPLRACSDHLRGCNGRVGTLRYINWLSNPFWALGLKKVYHQNRSFTHPIIGPTAGLLCSLLLYDG